MADQTTKGQEDEKLLSGFIPSDVYWKFKQAAAERKEIMKEAVLNAALLYIDAAPSPKEVSRNDR